jgi:hypothetical protein
MQIKSIYNRKSSSINPVANQVLRQGDAQTFSGLRYLLD